jgi:hypothetical protein
MTEKQYKQIANRYAAAFVRDEEEFTKLYDADKENYTAVDSIIILNLCEVYRMFLQGLISEAEGKKKTDEILRGLI